MNYELDHGELVRPSRFYSCGGHVSGTCNRHHCHYIAMVPLSRYVEEKPLPTAPHHPERPRKIKMHATRPKLPLLPAKKFRPPARHIAWANRTIAMLEAFKRGEPVQMRRSRWGGHWEDFDLGREIDGDGLIEWRAKPHMEGRNGNTIS